MEPTKIGTEKFLMPKFSLISEILQSSYFNVGFSKVYVSGLVLQ